MNKKLLALLLCLALVLGLAACGGGGADSAPAEDAPAADSADAGAEGEEAPAAEGDEIVLELWYWQSSLNDALLEKVPEQFPGVRINANKFNSENMQEKVITALASDSPLPDILAMDDWVSNVMPDADKFYNLYDEPFGAEQYKDNFVEWKWNNGVTPDGEKLIAIPIDAGPVVMYYRADLFEAAGLPTEPEEVGELMADWDGALEAAKTMKDATGVNMFDFTKNLYWMMMNQQEVGLIDKDDKFVGDQDHAKNAFYTAASFSDYVFGMPDMYGTEWGAAMDNGDVAAYCSAVWTIDMLKNVAGSTEGNWRVTNQPGGPGNYGGSCLGIPATSEHPEEAFEVILWLQNAENQIIQLQENSLFPTNVEALESPVMQEPDDFFGGQVINEYFIDATKNIPSQYVGLNYAAYRQYFYDELELIQNTGKDVDQAWEDALANCKTLEATL